MDELATLPAVAAEKARSLDLLGLTAGGRCLDVGCGTGPELDALAALVAPDGRVVGTDRSQALLQAARDRVRTGAELVVADAHRLPFAEAEFDACRADRTLQHLTDPGAALAEMARVTRPGGRVVVTELRWGLVAPGLDRSVTEAVLGAMAGPGERGGWLGHRLAELMAAAGLTDVRPVDSDHHLHRADSLAALLNLTWSLPAAVGRDGISAERAAAWERSLRALATDGQAFAGMVIRHVVGVRR